MTSINKLTKNQSVNDPDLFVIWDSDNQRTRSIEASNLAESLGLNSVNAKAFVGGRIENNTLIMVTAAGEDVIIGDTGAVDIDAKPDELVSYDVTNKKFIGTGVFSKNGEITVSTNTVNLDEAYSISSGGESLSIKNNPKNEFFRVMSHNFTELGNPRVKFNRISSGLVTPTPIDTDNIVNPDYQQVIGPFLTPPEDGQLVTFVDLKVDPSSVTTNISIMIYLNGVLFAQTIYSTLPPEVDPGIIRFTYENPIDVEVGDLFRSEITSIDGDVVLKGDTNTGVPYQRVDVIAWDYKQIGLVDSNGIADYNDTSTSATPLTLASNTWTTIPNDGQGSFTNLSYLPSGVTKLMNTTTGEFDFAELKLGDNCFIRNDFSVTPMTNNSLLEVRYQLGAAGSEYTLETIIGRLDSGSGKPYRFSLTPQMIYMGDNNTKDNPIKLQVRLSTNGTLVNAGSAIGVTKR